MIKILQYGLTDNLGGIETYLLKLTKNIDRTKFQFDFLILGSDKPCFYEELKELGCRFHFVTDRRKNPIANYKEISTLLDNSHYDIVHCNLNSLSYITPALLAAQKKIPTIVHSRNAGIPTSRVSRILHRINSKRLLKTKIKKLAVSNLAGEWMFEDDSEFLVINNGIDVQKYKYNESDRELIRNEFNIDKSEKLLIHTGAFREQKNHDFLIDIFNKVYKENQNTKLMLVGSGNLENDIKAKIKRLNLNDSVIFTGNRDDIPSLLSAADFFIFPSLYEGFPNSVIEAETSGLPCIISDSITKEVVINNNCFQLSLDKSAEYWAGKIVNILEKGITFRDKASEKVNSTGFSVGNEVKKIEQLYLDIINVKP